MGAKPLVASQPTTITTIPKLCKKTTARVSRVSRVPLLHFNQVQSNNNNTQNFLTGQKYEISKIFRKQDNRIELNRKKYMQTAQQTSEGSSLLKTSKLTRSNFQGLRESPSEKPYGASNYRSILSVNQSGSLYLKNYSPGKNNQVKLSGMESAGYSDSAGKCFNKENSGQQRVSTVGSLEKIHSKQNGTVRKKKRTRKMVTEASAEEQIIEQKSECFSKHITIEALECNSSSSGQKAISDDYFEPYYISEDLFRKIFGDDEEPISSLKVKNPDVTNNSCLDTNASEARTTSHSQVKASIYQYEDKTVDNSKIIKLMNKEKSWFQTAANSKRLKTLCQNNVPDIQKNIAGFTRYELHSLYSFYHALVKDTRLESVSQKNKNMLNLDRFKKGLAIALKIKMQAIQKVFDKQLRNPDTLSDEDVILDFNLFLKLVKKIYDYTFQQHLIQFIDVLFELSKEQFSKQDLIAVLRQYRDEQWCIKEVEKIYRKLNKTQNLMISKDSIKELCLADKEVYHILSQLT